VLFSLKAFTIRYKKDSAGIAQFGLVTEHVEKHVELF
jgi:hypothetical protein